MDVKTNLSLIVVGTILAISPVLADMPSPITVPWINHSQPPATFFGVDEPQHFAEIMGPDRSGVIEVLFTCENERGSNFIGNILLEFREGEKTVASVQYHCRGDRPWTVFHHVKENRRVNVDLSEVMDRVNNIKMQIDADVPAIQSARPISR
jgi:hypothetical protein